MLSLYQIALRNSDVLHYCGFFFAISIVDCFPSYLPEDVVGDALWKAVVAQRKKPRSLGKELDEFEPSAERPKTTSSLDDFESMFITNQVVHSFPNDKHTMKPARKTTPTTETAVEQCISNYKLQIPEVLPDEPVVETVPIFRPKGKITIRKKKPINYEESPVATGLLTSTPTKHGADNIDQSLDLFSNSSLVLDEDATAPKVAALCEDYGRHTVIDCSVG